MLEDGTLTNAKLQLIAHTEARAINEEQCSSVFKVSEVKIDEVERIK